MDSSRDEEGSRREERAGNGRFAGTLAGAAVTLSIALISFLASFVHEAFDPLVISLIFGMLVTNILGEREALEKGTQEVLRFFLPLGIGLYGMQLEFVGIGAVALLSVAAVFVFVFGVTFLIAKGFGLGRSIALLVSTGMSVCGAPAIAVVAPLLGAKREESAVSILAVMTIGLTGMLFYRLVPDIVGMKVENFAFFSGMTLPMLGQVKVASRVMGEECLRLATSFKLVRVAALALVAIAVLAQSGREKRKIRVPWFMVLFFVLAAAGNLSRDFASLRGVLSPLGTFSLTSALSAIGMSLEFDSVTARGATPLFAVFIAWGISVLTIYLALSFAG